MSSCSTRRHDFLSNKKKCLLVQQQDVSSCSTRCLFNKRTLLLVEQEDMSSSSTKKMWLLVQQGDMSSCATRSHAILPKKTCLPVHAAGYQQIWMRPSRVETSIKLSNFNPKSMPFSWHFNADPIWKRIGRNTYEPEAGVILLQILYWHGNARNITVSLAQVLAADNDD